MTFKNIILSILFFTLSLYGFSQAQSDTSNRIQIINAEYLEYAPDVVNAQRFVGDVQLQHQDVLMFCDSAYLYLDSNSLDAFGRIRVLQGDSLALYGDSLNYNGNTKLAKVRGNVKMNDRDLTLNSPAINYSMIDSIANYNRGATITSLKNQNTLISKIGLYFSNSETFQFRDSVKLTNPKYVMTSDTLTYNTISEIAYFSGPTTIISDSNEIYCENGYYNTKLDRSSFEENAYIISDGQKLQGDSLYYDRIIGIGEVFQNITITDTANNIIVKGHYGWHDEVLNISLITDSLLLIQTFEDDTLYLHADTAIIEIDSLENRNIYAFHHVRFYKSDLNGKCDSLVMNGADSTTNLYYDPVLWSEDNQLTADFIQIIYDSSKVDHINMFKNAFLISTADTLGYNQIKGRDMVAKFQDNQIEKLDVIGNAESIYFVADEDEPPVGMNSAICSSMTIHFKEKEVKTISFRDKPKATLHPMQEVTTLNSILNGFAWRIDEKPLTYLDLFK